MSLADSLLAAVDDKTDVGKLLQGLLSNPFQLQALRGEQQVPGQQPVACGARAPHSSSCSICMHRIWGWMLHTHTTGSGV